MAGAIAPPPVLPLKREGTKVVALKTGVSLFKLRTVALLVVVAVVSAIVASRGASWNLTSLAILAGAAALACAGSGDLNHYFDRDIDSLQSRTCRRPLPSGQVRPGVAALLGLAMILAALGLSWQLNWLVPLFIGLGALTYVVSYTCWLMRRTTQNIVIGGLAGSWAALAGWFTLSPEISPLLISRALLVFLWTPVHFWSFALGRLPDYRQAGLPMLPVVGGEKRAAQHIFIYAILSLISSAVLLFWGNFGLVFLVTWLLLAGIFCPSNIRLLREVAPTRAWSNYKLPGVYPRGLFLAMGIDVISSS